MMMSVYTIYVVVVLEVLLECFGVLCACMHACMHERMLMRVYACMHLLYVYVFIQE